MSKGLYIFTNDVTVNELNRAFCKGDIVELSDEKIDKKKKYSIFNYIDTHYEAQEGSSGKAHKKYELTAEDKARIAADKAAEGEAADAGSAEGDK